MSVKRVRYQHYQALSSFLETDEITLIDLDEVPPALALWVLQEGKLGGCRNPQRIADLTERVLRSYPDVKRLIRGEQC